MSAPAPIAQHLQAGIAVIVELVLTGSLLLLGREWKGSRRGAAMDPTIERTATIAAILLCFSTLWNVVLVVYHVVRAPDVLGSKDEFGAIAAGVAVLWYTDIMRLRRSVNKRRKVAILLASFPTFRFDKSGYHSPLSAGCRDSELVIRSADWHLLRMGIRDASKGKGFCVKAEKHIYWRGEVAFWADVREWGGGSGGGIVVLHEPATQDEAGSELLDPAFTHGFQLSKQLVADVVWSAVDRSQIWALFSWDATFGLRCAACLIENRGVRGIRSNELWRWLKGRESAVSVTNNLRTGHGAPMPEKDAKELREILWAAIVLEIFEYLGLDRELVLLPAIVGMPRDVMGEQQSLPRAMEEACESWRDLRR